MKTYYAKALVYGCFLSFIFSFSGCFFGNPKPSELIHIAHGLEFQLLPPETLGQEIDATQEVEIIYHGKSSKFIVHLEIEKQRMALVAVSPLGNRLFSVVYEKPSDASDKDYELRFDSAEHFKLPFSPAQILADIQLVFFPAHVLLNKSRLATLETKPLKRTIIKSNPTAKGLERKLISIEYSNLDPWLGPLTFRHFERKYQLHISTLEIKRNTQIEER